MVHREGRGFIWSCASTGFSGGCCHCQYSGEEHTFFFSMIPQMWLSNACHRDIYQRQDVPGRPRYQYWEVKAYVVDRYEPGSRFIHNTFGPDVHVPQNKDTNDCSSTSRPTFVFMCRVASSRNIVTVKHINLLILVFTTLKQTKKRKEKKHDDLQILTHICSIENSAVQCFTSSACTCAIYYLQFDASNTFHTVWGRLSRTPVWNVPEVNRFFG